MGPFLAAVLIPFVLFVLPIWIVAHYWSKMRSNRMLSRGDEQMLEEVWSLASKMEKRIETLETILDEKSNSWRKR